MITSGLSVPTVIGTGTLSDVNSRTRRLIPMVSASELTLRRSETGASSSLLCSLKIAW
jgi:hypothetical protein